MGYGMLIVMVPPTTGKRYLWTYMQGRNGEADVENRLVNTTGEGDGGTNGESSTEIYTSPRVKQLEGSCCVTRSSAWGSVMTQKGDGMEWQGGSRRRLICIHMADSHCWTAETNTTFQSNYSPTKDLKTWKERSEQLECFVSKWWNIAALRKIYNSKCLY